MGPEANARDMTEICRAAIGKALATKQTRVCSAETSELDVAKESPAKETIRNVMESARYGSEKAAASAMEVAEW